MAEEIYNTEVRDTNEDTVSIVTASSLDSAETVIHYHNGTDAEVTFAVSGSRSGDADFSEAVQLSSEAIAAGGSGYYLVSAPWDKVELSVVASTIPTTGAVTAHRMDSN